MFQHHQDFAKWRKTQLGNVSRMTIAMVNVLIVLRKVQKKFDRKRRKTLKRLESTESFQGRHSVTVLDQTQDALNNLQYRIA